MSALAKRLASPLTVTVFAAALTVGTADPASAHTCPSAQSPVAHGGKASWHLTCTSQGLKIYGWVEDTLPDTRCATVTATSEDGPGRIDMWQACGYGVRTNFDTLFPGSRGAEVVLRIIDTD
ncbi:hypothetical protein [Streptomyces sp. NPDC047024]|uniref:hypothetical protein n=1 Tax=Streptomyces sp. NPDC047024 TaxID=3155476 RepID=UPI0033ED6B01